jgi:hypothetical protein
LPNINYLEKMINDIQGMAGQARHDKYFLVSLMEQGLAKSNSNENL